ILHVLNGKVASVNGEIEALDPARPAVQLNEPEAFKKALQAINAKAYMWENPQMEQLIKEHKNDPKATFLPKGELVYAPAEGNFQQDKYVPAFKFDIYASEPHQRYNVFIDATTGSELYREDRIHTADSTGTAHTHYTGTQTIKTTYANNT